MNHEQIEQYELADTITPLVVGQKIVAATSDSMTLSNGVTLKLEGSVDCCAWGEASISDVVLSENVITAVTSVESPRNADEWTEKATVYLLTNAGPAAQINQEWNESNGYYFYGLYLTVTGVGA